MLLQPSARQTQSWVLAAGTMSHQTPRWLSSRAFASMLVILLGLPVFAQFAHTQINFVCPCAFKTVDGNTATLSFGLVNHTDSFAKGLHTTVGIVGDEITSTGITAAYSGFLDTIPLNVTVSPTSKTETVSYEIDLGVPPEGTYYLELILHRSQTVSARTLLDSVWFYGEVKTPISSLDLRDANYLLDSDGDNVADLNEQLEQTDPFDPNSHPPVPVIDILFIHEDGAFELFNAEPRTFIAYVLAITNYLYERSESPVQFRAVGTLDSSIVTDLGQNALEESRYRELMREYQADLVLVNRRGNRFLCGFALSIGGHRNRGFLHPNERYPYTELFLDSTVCSIDVTAHEIGHLMGLGHSFAQRSTGTFHWSRGHGVLGEFGTIMSYAEIVFAATAINVFSNPRINCPGKPCGVPHTEPNSAGSADAALSLNILKYQFARTSSPDANFDFDGDGVGAINDVFPIDASEWADTDGDKFGDNTDAFPNDPLEWLDTDGDGIGNNADPDIDNDGILNYADPNPFDAQVTQPKLVRVTSEQADDSFGLIIKQINDLDGDGSLDLAISAPDAVNTDGQKTGKVYLFSLADFIEPTSLDSETPGTKSLDDLTKISSTWVFHGRSEEERIGTNLAVLGNTNAETELIVISTKSIYLIQLNLANLQALDTEDDTQDRQISLAHCGAVAGCTRIDFGGTVPVTIAAPVWDLDGDARLDIGIVSYASSHLNVYFLSRQGIAAVASNTNESSITIDDVFAADSSSFVLQTVADLGAADLEYLGDPLTGEIQAIALGVAGRKSPGRVYILGREPLQKINALDTDGDRRLDIDALVAAPGGYRISNDNDSSFGYKVDATADLDNDGLTDLMVWGYRGENYIFTIKSIRFQDFDDGNIDGSFNVVPTTKDTFGTWLLNSLGIDKHRSSTDIFSTVGDAFASLLITPHSRSMITAPFDDLDYLDDPTGSDMNSVVNIPVRIRAAGIYRLFVPYGPHGVMELAGTTSLGDVDGDAKVDLAFTVFSQESIGTISTIFAVFSSEIDTLDQFDGDVDHIVWLHNDMKDTDGDGMPNILDDDDDGDGLQDGFDAYPLLSEYQYDADGDGFANANDAFPLDWREQFDIDFDGIGDNRDDDADGDGIPNDEDEFPLDSDNDGSPNIEDPDDDNDTVPDDIDVFPLDPSEAFDKDNDGVGDNADQFDDDPTEWQDTDQDGIGNNADPDDDNDGYPDTEDAFPLLATEWLDSDGDGYGDNSDAFPLDPLEWEDKDGDGFGDNYGRIGSFASYRLATNWRKIGTNAASQDAAETFRLGDFDRDGFDDLEFANVLPHRAGQPTILMSSADLESLDENDGQVNKSIVLGTVRRGPSSWQFRNPHVGFDFPRFSRSSVGDLNQDGDQDIVIFNALSYDASGSLTVVYGGNWSTTDGADGQIDGEIDLHQCVQNKDCTRLVSTAPIHRFGLNGSLIYNFAFDNEYSLTVGSFSNQTRSSGRAGIGAAYVLSHAAIATAAASSTDNIIALDSIVNAGGGFTLYPEYDALIPGSGVTLVGRVPDIDRDGVDELVLNMPAGSTMRFYILASSDIPAIDGADFQVDRKINLRMAYRQPNSFRIDGFELNNVNLITSTVHETANGEERTHFLPLLEESEPLRSHLIDIQHLVDHDRAEGTPNGVIQSFQTGVNNAWVFPGFGSLSTCKPDAPAGRIQGIASRLRTSEAISLSDSLELYLFDARDLSSLDMLDSVQDGSINLADTVGQGFANSWFVSFGKLALNSRHAQFTCAGDFDGDGQEDIAISFKNRDADRYRTQIVLLAYADLAGLDPLDGDEDSNVDLSILWPND